MKKIEELIGRKVKGFKFDGPFYEEKYMNSYIGKIGEIIQIYKNGTCVIYFGDEYWYYPTDQIEAHLVEEELTLTIEKEIPTLTDGVMMLVSDSKINWYDKDVKFIYNGRYYTFEEHNLTFVPWIHCKPPEPTKEEQLTAILGNSDKVAEIMELFKKD